MVNDIFYNNNTVSNKLLLTTQEASKVLGVPKKVVQNLIETGLLQAISASDKMYVTRNALAEMTGENNAAHFGHLASGQTSNSTIYYNHSNDCTNCEDDYMFNKKYTGSVSALKDGGYMAQIDMGRTPEGKRIRPSKRFKTREDAERYLNLRLSELNGVFQPYLPTYSQTPTFYTNQYTTLTFEEYSKNCLNAGVKKASSITIEGYRTSLAPVLDDIGSMKMTEITEQHLKKMYTNLSYKCVDSTLKKAFNTVKMIYDIALKQGDVPKTPFLTIECPKSLKPNKNEKIPYTKEEIETIFTKAKTYHNKMLYPLFVLYECTGMRPGELRALEWSSFSAEEKKIKIIQAVSKRYEQISDMRRKPKTYSFIKPTKSKYGRRELYLSDLAVSALLQWKNDLKNMSEAERDSIYIFPSENGDFRTEDSVDSLIDRFKISVGIKSMGINQYRFRHTMCTRLILAKIPLPVVQIIMGDNTLKVIMETYTHIQKQQALESCKEYYRELNEVHEIMSVALSGKKIENECGLIDFYGQQMATGQQP